MKIEEIKELILKREGEFSLRDLENDISKGNIFDSYNVSVALKELNETYQISLCDITGSKDNWETEWKWKVGKCNILKF